jgi:hypothetical protein
MKQAILLLLALALCVETVLWMPKLSTGTSNEYMTSWLTIAGMIVAIATLSQVVFAVVAYVESATLQRQIRELHSATQQQHDVHREEINQLSEIYYGTAKAAIAGLMEAFHYSDRGPIFEIAMRNLKDAQINVDLAHGTYLSLWGAMQNAFKLDRKRFLELEPQIWERSNLLAQNDRERVRKDFKKLKAEVLKRI